MLCAYHRHLQSTYGSGSSNKKKKKKMNKNDIDKEFR